MTRSQFRLKKLSIEKGVVKYTAVVTVSSGSESFDKVLTAKETRFPHPDLTDRFKGPLREVVNKVMGYGVPFDMISKSPNIVDDEKEALVTLRYRIEEMKQRIIDNINVVGVTFNGSGDTSGVVIEHIYVPYMGKSTRIKTPSITLKSSLYGIEELLAEVSETIEDEAYLYIFEDKVSQTEIEFDE